MATSAPISVNGTPVVSNNTDFDLTPVLGDSVCVATALVLTLISNMVLLPLFYGIIWYEVNTHIRTLINQLLALGCWTSLWYAIWNLVFATARFLLGPLNDALCGLDIILMNTAGMCQMTIIYCIVITKYAFVHFMKNPVALDDEFFKFFIGLSSGLLSFLSQVAFVLLPGRNPLRFSACIGKIPVRYITENVPVKFNLPFYLLVLLGCIIMAGIFVLRKFRKKKISIEALTTAAPVERILIQQSSLLFKAFLTSNFN